MLPNISGPMQSRRLRISTVVSSILLYAAAVWAPSLKVEANRRKIAAPYRLSALRTSCSYRTTSDETACVIAGMIPIDTLANEGRRLYDPSYAIGESYIYRRQLARSKSILEWKKDRMIHLKDAGTTGLFQMSLNGSSEGTVRLVTT